MNLPKLDLAMLPDLNLLTGLFGSIRTSTPGHNDTIVVLATIVYETQPPGSGII